MDKNKRKDKPTRDFWDEIFGTSFNEFMNMRREMEEIFRSAMKSSFGGEKYRKPFVYGFSVRVGPDGIPHVQQFGDTRFRKGPKYSDEQGGEREPLTDIIEAEDHVAITLELPGVEKEDINMEIEEETLIIDVDTESRKYHKELKLPENLDSESIEATYKNGVLDIVIKRKKEKPKKGKRINIK